MRQCTFLRNGHQKCQLDRVQRQSHSTKSETELVETKLHKKHTCTYMYKLVY